MASVSVNQEATNRPTRVDAVAPGALDPARLGPVSGSRVIVAGGCGGMGRVLVRALCDTGVQVAVLDQASALAQHPPPADVLAFAMDGSDAGSVRDAFAAVRAAWPQADGFCNLIGFMKSWVRITEMPVEAFDEVVAGNLRAHFLCAQAALPLLAASGNGVMVNVSSTLGMDVGKGYVHYSASKAGLIALTKSLAKETATRGVLVNAVTPAAARTALFAQMTRAHVDYMLGKIPMGRFVEVAEIAAMVAWLASEECSFSTGAVFDISGGRATY